MELKRIENRINRQMAFAERRNPCSRRPASELDLRRPKSRSSSSPTAGSTGINSAQAAAAREVRNITETLHLPNIWADTAIQPRTAYWKFHWQLGEDTPGHLARKELEKLDEGTQRRAALHPEVVEAILDEWRMWRMAGHDADASPRPHRSPPVFVDAAPTLPSCCRSRKLRILQPPRMDSLLKEKIAIAKYPNAVPGIITGPLRWSASTPMLAQFPHSCYGIDGCSGSPVISHKSGKALGVFSSSENEIHWAIATVSVKDDLRSWLQVDQTVTMKQMIKLL
uniref:MADS-box domain-containing protein n=1 Tax=Oryza meridionalis TaxID=40149 RepID=A0A0E0EXT0_9ORYZ